MRIDTKRLSLILHGVIFLSLLVALGTTSKPAISANQAFSNQKYDYVPTCLNRIGIPESEMYWIYVPETADQIHSEYELFWLAGRLIEAGVVDASTCPAGGLGADSYANACGMSLAKTKVIEIQNSLNQAIIDSWETAAVPPILLKQLIYQESQFWPAKAAPFHYGLGHITPIGMLNALQWNTDLYNKACTLTNGNCGINSSTADFMLGLMVGTCPACPNGIDSAKAKQSVEILAQAVMGYCNQTAQLIFNATGWRSGLVVTYPTIWRLTLMNYNAGSVCVFDTVAAAFKDVQGPLTWGDIVAHIDSEQCSRGAYYATQVTTKAYDLPPK